MFNGLAHFLHTVIHGSPQQPSPQHLNQMYANTQQSPQPLPLGVAPHLDGHVPMNAGSQRMAGNFNISGGTPSSLVHPFTYDPRMSINVPDNTAIVPNAALRIYQATPQVDQAHGIHTNYAHPNYLIPNAIKPTDPLTRYRA